MLAPTRQVEERLPFALLGFDSDNGGEFLNHHLWSYMRERKVAVAFTRSRRYHSDDNAQVEQKNWTRARQLLGYGEKAAWLLGFAPHAMPILATAGLLKPLGQPTPNAVKYFASATLCELRQDTNWLFRASKEFMQHWWRKNGEKNARLTSQIQPNCV